MYAGTGFVWHLLAQLQRFSAWIWTAESGAGVVIFYYLSRIAKYHRLRQPMQQSRTVRVLRWFEMYSKTKMVFLGSLLIIGIVSLFWQRVGQPFHPWIAVMTLLVLLAIPLEVIFLGYMAWRLLAR